MANNSSTVKRDQFWRGPPSPVEAWAALDRDGKIMPASVRDSIQGVKLACGECVPVRVRVTFVLEDSSNT